MHNALSCTILHEVYTFTCSFLISFLPRNGKPLNETEARNRYLEVTVTETSLSFFPSGFTTLLKFWMLLIYLSAVVFLSRCPECSVFISQGIVVTFTDLKIGIDLNFYGRLL